MSYKSTNNIKTSNEFYIKNDKYKYVIQAFRKSGYTVLTSLNEQLHDIFPHSGNPVWRRIELEGWNKTLDQYEGYYKISVIRNTFDRVISMYFNRILNIHYAPPIDKFDIKSQMTFDDFIDELPNLIKGEDRHFYSQEASIDDTIDVHVELKNVKIELPQIFRFKLNMDNNDLLTTHSVLHTWYNSSKINKSLSGIKFNSYNFQKNELNIKIEQGLPPKNTVITKENIAKIQKIYTKEIEYFNFTYDHLL